MQDPRCQFPYTRTLNFGSLKPVNFTVTSGVLFPEPEELGKFLLRGIQFFDEGHAVNLVQGRNSAENLLQG